MKKLLSYLFLLVAVVCLAACTAVVSVDSLQVSGQKTGFVLGEEFSTGEMTVIAIFTNGNEEDVTSKVKVTPSTDMTQAGNFVVEVYYEGCTAKYNIFVEQPQLVSIDVNHEAVVKTYKVGQEVSTEGLVVTGHYTNSITGATQEVVEAYEVVVTNAAGAVVEGAFEYVGEYTVSVEFGGFAESYKVTVSNEYASVYEAIEAGAANAHKVASGKYSVNYSWGSSNYEYAFGDNYFTYADEYGTTYHYSLNENGEALGASVSEDYVSSYIDAPEYILGCQQSVIYYSVTYYGADGMVQSLYQFAKDLEIDVVESISEGVYSYSYNYTYEELDWFTEEILYSYYVINVEFKLGEGSEIKEATFTLAQYYAEQIVVAEDGTWTVIEGQVSEDQNVYKFEQVAGERTLENPYSAEKVMYKSFDLQTLTGEAAPAEVTIMAGESVNLVIANALPETAISGFNNFDFICDSFGYYAYESDGILSISVYSAGTYDFTIVTGSIEKTIRVIALQPQPESVAAYASEYVDFGWYAGYEMMETSTATVEAGGKLYIGGAIYPSKADQEVTIALKEEYADVSLTEVSYDDFDAPYYDGLMLNFNSSTIGTYVVVITSVANPELSCELTITVVEASEEENEATFEGTWTAVHPMTGMVMATIEIFRDYSYFSDGMSQIMMGWSLEGSNVTFMVGVNYQGTLSITDAVVNEDYTVMTATVTYMGTEMQLTFTK